MDSISNSNSYINDKKSQNIDNEINININKCSDNNLKQNDENDNFLMNNNNDDNNYNDLNDINIVNNNNDHPNLQTSILSQNLFNNNNNKYFLNDSKSNINNIYNIHIEQNNYKNTMTFNGEDKKVSLIQLESGDIATSSNDYKERILGIKTGICMHSFFPRIWDSFFFIRIYVK